MHTYTHMHARTHTGRNPNSSAFLMAVAKCICESAGGIHKKYLWSYLRVLRLHIMVGAGDFLASRVRGLGGWVGCS